MISPMPIYVPSFITGSHLHGTIELNGIEIIGEDDEGVDFVAAEFYKHKVLPKIGKKPITKIELWDLHCSGETLAGLIKMLSDHLCSQHQTKPLKDLRFMSHKALKGVKMEELQMFAEKCDSLERLIISGTKNCVEETRGVLTDFVVKMI